MKQRKKEMRMMQRRKKMRMMQRKKNPIPGPRGVRKEDRTLYRRTRRLLLRTKGRETEKKGNGDPHRPLSKEGIAGLHTRKR